MAGCWSVLGAFLFEYDTPRIVLIRSRKVGLMNRAVQLFILAYVIGWVFVWEKGYQEVDSVVSSVTTKAKGVTVTNTSQLGFRIWDVADYVIPAQEESSLFIMTNIIVTMNQTQGFCPELPDKTSVCKSDSDCPAGSTNTHSSGVATGRCVPYNGTLKTCEVATWCPVENDSNVPKPAFLKAAENFTLLVKNNIWYPKFNFTKRNILPNITTTYLKSCIYNAATDPFCPIFHLGKIVENAGHSFQDMAVEGGIMGIQIKWDCDLDRAASFCPPRYSFRRLDTRDLDHNVSPGYNFRAFHFLLLVGLLWLFWSQLQDESEPFTMPACCDDMFLYETNKVIQIQNTSYGTIKWFFHMIVFSYVRKKEFCCQKKWEKKVCQFPQTCQSVQVAKVVHIQSLWIGILKNLIITGILVYMCFALLCDKRYQRKEPLTSSVHTKVKGIAEVREEILENGEEVHRVFDTADYSFPVQGNSFFVMTNFLKTKGQVQGLCPEHPTRRTLCSSDRGCKKGWLDPQSKGIQTGKCIRYNLRSQQKTCEVSAWCPTEATEEPPQPALLNSAENFTVLIKNNIDFPRHNYTTRNILPDLNITCTYHKTQNPQCPIFRLGDIFQETGYNFSEVAIKGGIMGIEINWDCNLDSWFHHCRPKYSFQRLDDKTTNESLYPGYNFRYAKYYKENNVEKRTLIKVFGVRFDILVFGNGGKFDIIALIVYIGSTLSYFGLATVFIDFLINTYSNTSCQSYVYPYCKCCECCAVNEYYYKKKCESIVEPKSTLKYVSFVDEFHIRMVEEQLLGRSLQDVKGKEIPRPLMDFTDLSRLPLSLQDPPPIPGQPEEIQLLSEEATPRSSSSPSWCQCGNCLPSQLPRSHQCLEELCCRKKPGACITTSEPFKQLILSRRALQFLLLYQEPLLKLDADATNNQLRHCAYRCYATWRFGSKDLADFAILPSCCRWRIRKEFPKSEGQYSGFKSPY